MANLQVRDIDEKLYASLKKLAAGDKRSLSQEVVFILQKYLSSPDAFKENPTNEFLKLVGSWDDERLAEDIVAEIRNNRRNSARFRGDDGLFD